MEHRPIDLTERTVRAALSGMPLGGLRVFDSISSTNDDALAWIRSGAPDLALVVADEQTAGRGRAGRKWITRPGTALALSLIVHAEREELAPGRLVGLGALAVTDAAMRLGMPAQIKWPNDVLIRGRKVAGVLVEAVWSGDRLEAAVLGIGINVRAGSAPPDADVPYPAISIEDALGIEVSRVDVLQQVVAAALRWHAQLLDQSLIEAWQERLAFRGKEIRLTQAGQPTLAGTLLGLGQDGSLRLLSEGREIAVRMGEMHLQPTDVRMQ